MKIFITGASGFIGSHLAKHLLGDGHLISAVGRSFEQMKHLQERGVDITQSDLLLAADLRPLIRGHDCVIHCAAHVGFWASQATYDHLNVELTKRLLRASIEAGAKQFIYMSCANVALHGQQALLSIDEYAQLCEDKAYSYAYSKRLADDLVLNSQLPSFRAIALRPAFVWGRGDMVDRQIGPAANSGRFGWFDHGRYPYSTCYINNLCDAVLQLVQIDNVRGAFFLSDDQTMSLRDFFSARLHAGGYTVPNLSIPRGFAKSFARFTENGWKYLPLRGEPPLVREAVRTMAYPFTVSSQRAKNLFGYSPKHSIEQGIKALQADNRKTL